MRTIPEAMRDRLQAHATTLCHCWILRRADGVVLGFTDHDREIEVDGVRCEPASGLVPGDFEEGSGLSGDGSQVAGALNSDRIAEHDLLNGGFDDARVDRYLVDWQAPDSAMLLSRAVIGEVSRDGDSFSAELRSVASLLDRRQTRYFSRLCDAELGDARCGVAMDQEDRTISAVVEAVNGRIVTCAPSTLTDPSNFVHGRLQCDGSPDAQVLPIMAAKVLPTGRLALTINAAPSDIKADAGTRCTLLAGCDKRFATCRDRFANAEAFRGFPHIPGSRQALVYADREGGFDGTPLVP